MIYVEKTTGILYELLYGPIDDLRANLRAQRAKANNQQGYDPFDLERPIKQVVIIIRKDPQMTQSPLIWDYDLFIDAFELHRE